MLNSVTLPAEKAGRVLDALELAFHKSQSIDIMLDRPESLTTILIRTALKDVKDAMFPERIA